MVNLKQNHSYYRQIQLGIIMLNVSCYGFILYNSFDHNYQVITIDFNYDYYKYMLLSLKSNYFDRLSHDICILSESNCTNV